MFGDTCLICNGKGFWVDRETTGYTSVVVDAGRCLHCNGTGKRREENEADQRFKEMIQEVVDGDV